MTDEKLTHWVLTILGTCMTNDAGAYKASLLPLLASEPRNSREQNMESHLNQNAYI